MTTQIDTQSNLGGPSYQSGRRKATVLISLNDKKKKKKKSFSLIITKWANQERTKVFLGRQSLVSTSLPNSPHTTGHKRSSGWQSSYRLKKYKRSHLLPNKIGMHFAFHVPALMLQPSWEGDVCQSSHASVLWSAYCSVCCLMFKFHLSCDNPIWSLIIQ